MVLKTQLDIKTKCYDMVLTKGVEIMLNYNHLLLELFDFIILNKKQAFLNALNQIY